MERSKQEMIEDYANQVWGVMAQGLRLNGIEYGRDYTDVSLHNSIMVMTVSLAMVNTSQWKRLSALSVELSQILGLKDDSRVRIGFDGLDYRIEIPKPPELMNKIEFGDLIKHSRKMKTAIGVSTIDDQPAFIDFGQDTSGHILASGGTRCGKTNLIMVALRSLIARNSPDKMRIAIIDVVKSNKYKALENSTHLASPIINTPNKAINFLRWVKGEILRLKGMKNDKKILIFIDEAHHLAKNAEAVELLGFISATGAESGFHLIITSQYTNVDDIGGRLVKGNLMTRICGKVDDHYASLNATGRKEAGAENLMVPGDFLCVTTDKMSRIATPRLDDKLFDSIERGTSPIVEISDDDDIDSGPMNVEAIADNRPGSIGACFEAIDERLLGLAIYGQGNGGRPYGADVIRKASGMLAKKGLGKSIGQNTANEYVKFAAKIRKSMGK